MSTQLWPSTVHRCGLLVVLLASASFAVAQPPRPPAPDDGVRPAPQAEVREPGYLGLIADDRREQGAGVRVVKVVEGSPAASAGIQVNDLITAIDGQAVGSLAAMGARLEPRVADDKVRFEVRRGDTTRTVEVSLGRRPPREERPFEFGRIPERLPEPPTADSSATAIPPRAGLPPEASGPPSAVGSRGQLLGIRSGPVSEPTRIRLGVPEAGGALVVARVVGSPADKAGIPLDAVIVAVNEQPVTSPADLARLIEAAGPGKEVEVTYYSRGERQKAAVTLASVAPSPRPARDASPFAQPDGAPLPEDRDVARPITASDRIEQLERRIRELERRLELIEQALRRGQP
jgi:membrane-associated protease RseP (regulator of RpoE activity)